MRTVDVPVRPARTLREAARPPFPGHGHAIGHARLPSGQRPEINPSPIGEEPHAATASP